MSDSKDEGGMPDTRFGTQACEDELKSHGISLKPPSFTGSASDICENCRFCKRVEKQYYLISDGFNSGGVNLHKKTALGKPYDEWTCHLSAPIEGESWPEVTPDDFCGEFMAKPVEEGTDDN